jgi:IMP cyclohydrolase
MYKMNEGEENPLVQKTCIRDADEALVVMKSR